MVERIANYKYIKQGEVTDAWLSRYGFMYDKICSDKDDPAYTLRFPVYKYGGLTTLDGCITIWPNADEDNKIRVNCYEHNSRTIFARFYYWEYGNDDDFMSIINHRIKKKMKELDIRVIEPDGEEHEYAETEETIIDTLEDEEEIRPTDYY